MTEQKLWNSNYLKVWTGNFLINFAFVLIVPLLPLYLSQTYGATKDVIGLVLAGYSVTALLVRPFSGYLVDTLSRKAVLVVCNFLFVGMFIGYIAAGSLTAFAIFRTLHGAPFGAVTVSINTAAIDVLPPSRRTEGIGYYGLSNNLATAIGPVLAVYMLEWCNGNFQILFTLSFLIALLGLFIDSTITLAERTPVKEKKVISFDRFFLTKGFREAFAIICFAISYGIVQTYVAIYGKEELGIARGTGLFFTLFAIGLIVSRLTGAHALREGKITRNAIFGVIVSALGYTLFASVPTTIGYYISAFIIGMGNGHMWPAFQNMFIDLAENSQRGTAISSILTAWDAGVGLGVMLGGFLSEHSGYHTAFWCSAAVNIVGMLYYFLRIKNHFETNRLR